MEKSGFFKSIDGDRRYYASDFADYFGKFIGNGIYILDGIANLQVIAKTSMTITLKPGAAFINGHDYSNTANLDLTLDLSDGYLSRIDRLVLRCDENNSRAIYAAIVKGENSTAPVPTPLRRDAEVYEIALADIRVNKGAISIKQEDITDMRMKEDVCGVVKALGERTVETKNLFLQFEAEFKKFMEENKTELGGDVAGNLLNRINKKVIVSKTAPPNPSAGDIWIKIQ